MRLTPKWSLYKLGLPARMIQRLYDVRWRQGLLASCYFIFVANSDMNAIVVFSRTGMTQDGVSHLLLLVETNVKSNFCINMSTFQTATRKLSTLTLAYYPRRINDVYRRLARLAPIPGINNWLPGRTLSNSNEKERATWWPPPLSCNNDRSKARDWVYAIRTLQMLARHFVFRWSSLWTNPVEIPLVLYYL